MNPHSVVVPPIKLTLKTSKRCPLRWRSVAESVTGKPADLAKAAGKHKHINGYGMLNVAHELQTNPQGWKHLKEGKLQLLKVCYAQ